MARKPNPGGTIAIVIVAALIVAGTLFLRRRGREGTKEIAVPSPPADAVASNRAAFTPPPLHLTSHEALVAALADLNSEGDAMLREEKLEAWVNEVAYADIPELIELIRKESPSKLTREMKLRLVRKLAGNDPRAAALLVAQEQEGAERSGLLNATASIWAGLNLQDAIAWARELPEEDRSGALVKIANEAIATDPRTALQLARDLPGSDARTELIGRVASEWATKDPQQIADWAEKIEDRALREDVLSKVAITWGETEPAKAAALALQQLSPGKPQNDAIIGIVQQWVQNRPVDAAAWVAKFPEGELRETAARELVSLWADKNISDAGQWINELPEGASKDAAASGYVAKLTAADPQTAVKWIKASSLSDEAKQKFLNDSGK